VDGAEAPPATSGRMQRLNANTRGLTTAAAVLALYDLGHRQVGQGPLKWSRGLSSAP